MITAERGSALAGRLAGRLLDDVALRHVLLAGVGLARRGDDEDDRVRVARKHGARRELDLAGVDLRAGLESLDGQLDRPGDGRGLDLERERVQLAGRERA